MVILFNYNKIILKLESVIRLHTAIKNSTYVMSIWKNNELINLISAISDGAINIFLSYLLVKTEYQKHSLGRIMMNNFCKEFEGYGRRIWFVIDGIVTFNIKIRNLSTFLNRKERYFYGVKL